MRAKLKPQVVLRVEKDGYALLYDPDTGNTFVLDPVSLFISERLNGTYSIEKIIEESRTVFEDVPADAAEQVKAFVEELIAKELAEV